MDDETQKITHYGLFGIEGGGSGSEVFSVYEREPGVRLVGGSNFVEVQQKLVRFKCAHGTMVHTELFLDSISHLCWMET